MKKGPHDEMNGDLRPEYDLSQLLSHSVQGKYAERFRAERIVMPTADQNHGKLSDKPAAGLDRDEWQRRLVKLESRYGYADGFKLLYCPWSTLFEGCEVAFLSMHPGGRTPDSADLRTVSDERGNSYRIERYTTKSPITEQYLQLCELMRVSPDRVLCGVLAPFRTKEWKAPRDGQNLAIGRAFWETALRVQSSLKVLVCSGKPVKDALIDMLGGELDRSVPAEWGNIRIRQYHIADPPCSLIALPQLSRFRLLSRPASRRQVASVLEEWDLAEEGHPWPDLPKTSTKTDSRRMCFEQGKAFVYMPPRRRLARDHRVAQRGHRRSSAGRRHDHAHVARRSSRALSRRRPRRQGVSVHRSPGHLSVGAPLRRRDRGERGRKEHLVPQPNFYDADSIAQGLGSYDDPTLQFEARTRVDAAIGRHLEQNELFGFESTYSGASRPRIARRAHELGYATYAIFVGTRDPSINIDRVAARVRARTGHHVPESEIRRTWTAAQDNLVKTTLSA